MKLSIIIHEVYTKDDFCGLEIRIGDKCYLLFSNGNPPGLRISGSGNGFDEPLEGQLIRRPVLLFPTCGQGTENPFEEIFTDAMICEQIKVTGDKDAIGDIEEFRRQTMELFNAEEDLNFMLHVVKRAMATVIQEMVAELDRQRQALRDLAGECRKTLGNEVVNQILERNKI